MTQNSLQEVCRNLCVNTTLLMVCVTRRTANGCETLLILQLTCIHHLDCLPKSHHHCRPLPRQDLAPHRPRPQTWPTPGRPSSRPCPGACWRPERSSPGPSCPGWFCVCPPQPSGTNIPDVHDSSVAASLIS